MPPGGARPPAGPPAAAAAPAVAGTSVAVIDIAYIFKNHVRFNGQMNDMKRDIEAYDAAMRDETTKINKKQETMTAFNPNSKEFKAADEELAHLKSDFQIKVAAKRREFLEQEAKVYYGIYREIEDAVAMFAQRNRIGLVLRYTGDEMKPDDRASVLQGVNKPVVYQDRSGYHAAHSEPAQCWRHDARGWRRRAPPAPGADPGTQPFAAGTQNAQRQPPAIPQRPGHCQTPR